MTLYGCWCADPECRLTGCKIMRDQIRKSMPPQSPVQCGCICPPGAEMTCMGDNCPRRSRHGLSPTSVVQPGDAAKGAGE